MQTASPGRPLSIPHRWPRRAYGRAAHPGRCASRPERPAARRSATGAGQAAPDGRGERLRGALEWRLREGRFWKA